MNTKTQTIIEVEGAEVAVCQAKLYEDIANGDWLPEADIIAEHMKIEIQEHVAIMEKVFYKALSKVLKEGVITTRIAIECEDEDVELFRYLLAVDDPITAFPKFDEKGYNIELNEEEYTINLIWG